MFSHLFLAEGEQVDPLEADLARGDATGRRPSRTLPLILIVFACYRMAAHWQLRLAHA
jgi:hypothetical protein